MKKIAPPSFVAVLTAVVFFPSAAVALLTGADPITISLDNPNQMVAAPLSGYTAIDFSGTVTFDPSWEPNSVGIDWAYNGTGDNHLDGDFNSDFLIFSSTRVGPIRAVSLQSLCRRERRPISMDSSRTVHLPSS